MNNGIQVFENSDFGKVRVVERNGEPWFVAADVCTYFGVTNRNRIMQAVDAEDKGGTQMDTPGGIQTLAVVNESGLYSMLFALKPTKARGVSEEHIAERQTKIHNFKRWVTHEVIPSIRKTGTYSTRKPDSYMIDDPIARAQRWIEEAQERLALQETVNEQRKEIEYKENIIIGFVEDIDLATKRQRINQIIKHNVRGGALIAARWEMLYKEFEMKYHVNLKARMESDTYANIKPKLKSKMDLIDRGMGMTAELFEIACKLFENDVDELKKEWDVTCAPHIPQTDIACC